MWNAKRQEKKAKGRLNAHRGYYEPRATRGLSDRVFFDPSRRRKARVIFSAGTLIIGVIAWLVFFAITVGLDGGLEAALPEPISTLKGHTASPRNSLLVEEEHGFDMPAIDLYAQQELQKYQCLNRAGQGAAPSQTLKVYAVVPAELPWATHSLNDSCDTLHVAMPTWFHFTELDGHVQVGKVSLETRQPLLEQSARDGTFGIMPVLQWDAAALGLLRAPNGPAKVSAALDVFLDQPAQAIDVKGYCIDASLLALVEGQTFSVLSRRVTSQLKSRGLETCVRLPSNASDGLLVIANRFFDTVVVKGYQEHWIGSAPQPLAGKRWLEEHIKTLKEHVAPSKLVVELGTHSMDWVSGSPRPEVLPFAKAMSALAQHDAFATLVPAVGNTRASYLDSGGLQHQLWLLDAISAHNQILTLKKHGIQALSLSGLGYEDPGIWAVLDQTTRGMTLPPVALKSVLLSNYVALTGSGPFVAPLSMPQMGKRTIKTDPETGEITSATYDKMPQAAAGKLYGEGEPNKVVLTFDDGPHPQHTPAALDILRQTQTPASFFVLGSSALASPDLVRRILAEGHELGSHTYSHPNMAEISASRAKMEANSTQLLINGITGKNMRLYREPYMRSGGPITSREVASLLPLEEAGYVIAGMNIVPRDWVEQTSDELADEIIRQVELNGGGVVLLHDGGGDQHQTVAALPRVISELRDKGYTFTTLADLLGVSPDILLPDGDPMTATLGNVSFFAMGSGWTVLQIAFWTVFAVGVARSASLLLLAARRQRHTTTPSGHEPSVTIVIPAYNEEQVIEQCIRKALLSEYPDFDIIVVDDGSSDDTYLKAASFLYHPLVTVLKQPNRGKAAALNAALDESQSDILICIDADSQIAPDAVRLLAAHFESPNVGAVAGKVVVGNRRNLLTRLQALEYVTSQAIERRAKEYINAITVVPGAIGAWRTTALMEAGIFSTETLTEDADMTMAIIRSKYKVLYEDRAIARTEVPASLTALMTQRLRWSLGMMQAGWKHLGATMEGRALGLVALPDLAVFGYLMPLLAPLADLFIVILIVEFVTDLGTADEHAKVITNPLLIAYLMLPALEMLSAISAFRLDAPEDRRLLLLLPLQRLFYRQILYLSVIRAVWRAATGSLANWGRMTRVGFQFDTAKRAS
ncbi:MULTISPECIES: glycosyltransferase [unclassified Sulfitobacter]|uniref:glycosyltransferase n=1 Tax=unclassified Sulfitobacter TaxID=196795 RepID=UPI0037472889